MTSSRPYLIRALYEWIVDNGLTPHLLVDTERGTVDVPSQYVQEGKVVLNVGPSAVQGLELGNDEVAFSARFGGQPRQIVVAMPAVTAIYARENGKGMVFADEDGGDDHPPPDSGPEGGGTGSGRPKLQVVK